MPSVIWFTPHNLLSNEIFEKLLIITTFGGRREKLLLLLLVLLLLLLLLLRRRRQKQKRVNKQYRQICNVTVVFITVVVVFKTTQLLQLKSRSWFVTFASTIKVRILELNWILTATTSTTTTITSTTCRFLDFYAVKAELPHLFYELHWF